MPYADKAKDKEYHRLYVKAQVDAGYFREYQKTHKESRSLSSRRSVLRKMYGITLERYLEMVAQQSGLCAICKRPELDAYPDGTLKGLSVDHDHATGIVRGLLCRACNVGMGNLGDNPDRLRAAIEYLEMPRAV